MTRRIRLGSSEKIELEIVGEDGRVYVLRGVTATRIVAELRAHGGGEVRATFAFEEATVALDAEPDLGRAEPKRDARGKKRPPESYGAPSGFGAPQSYARSSWVDPRSPFARGAATSDGWPEDMADPSVDERFKREPEPPPFDPFKAPPRGARERPGGAPFSGFDDFFRRMGFPPPPRPRRDESWRAVLENPADLFEAERVYRHLAKQRHPDRGGTHEQMVELNAAIDAARRYFR